MNILKRKTDAQIRKENQAKLKKMETRTKQLEAKTKHLQALRDARKAGNEARQQHPIVRFASAIHPSVKKPKNVRKTVKRLFKREW